MSEPNETPAKKGIWADFRELPFRARMIIVGGIAVYAGSGLQWGPTGMLIAGGVWLTAVGLLEDDA
jgi:hypothetical protein